MLAKEKWETKKKLEKLFAYVEKPNCDHWSQRNTNGSRHQRGR